MATTLEELLIALKVTDEGVKQELNNILNQAKRTGTQAGEAMQPFNDSLKRTAAEVRAGLRPLSDYRRELQAQERELQALARSQDRNSAAYRETTTRLGELKRELGSVTREIQQQETMFDRLGGTLTRFGGRLTVAVTTPLTLLAGAGLKSTMQLEVLERTLQTLLGSAEDAKMVFDQLREYEFNSIFGGPELEAAARQLAAFGTEAHDIVPTIDTLGEVAAGLNIGLGDIVDTYGRMQVSGRVTMLELNQLMTKGVPIVQELSKNLGVTTSEIQEMASSGKLNFGMIEDAFASLTAEGGMFFGKMSAQGETVQGQLAFLRKDFEALADVAGGILMPVARDLIGTARSAFEWFDNLDEGTQRLIVSTGLLAGALGPVLVISGQLITSVGRLRTGLIALRTGGLVPLLGPLGVIAGFVTVTSILNDTLLDQGSKVDGLISDYDSYRTALVVTSEAERDAARDRLQTLKTELQERLRMLEELAASEQQSAQGFIDSWLGRFLLPGFLSIEGGANPHTLRDIDSVRGAIAGIGRDLDALDSGATTLVTPTPRAPRSTTPGGGTPSAPGGTTTGKATRTVSDVLEDHAAALAHARTVAVAYGETLEALAVEANASISATSRAIDELLTLGVEATDERVQNLVRDLGGLQTEADRLNKQLTPVKLTDPGAYATVDETWKAAQDAVVAYEAALADAERRTGLGMTTAQERLQEELQASNALLNALVPLWGGLNDEQRQYALAALESSRATQQQIQMMDREADRLERNRQRRIAAQAGDARPGTFSTREEQAAFLADVRERREAAAAAAAAAAGAQRGAWFRPHVAGQAATATVQAEARELGREITKALQTGSVDDLDEFEATLVQRLQELGDDARGAVFAGLLTTVRSGRALLQTEADDLAQYMRMMSDPSRQRRMIRAEAGGPGAGMRTFDTPGELTDALLGSASGRRKTILEDLARSLSEVDARAAALGDSVNVAGEKSRLLQTAITNLISTGLVPSSASIQQLVEDWGEYQEVLAQVAADAEREDSFHAALAWAQEQLGEMPGPLERNIALLEEYHAELAASGDEANALATEVARLIEKLRELQDLENSKLRQFSVDVDALAGSLQGLGSTMARATAQVAGGLSKIVDEGDKLGGVTEIVRGLTTAIDGVLTAARDGGLGGEDVFDLITGIASVSAEAIGAMSGLPGLGQLAAASFGLLKSIIGDLSNGLKEIREHVDGVERSTRLLSRETLDAFADQYTRTVSRGGIAGSFGGRKAELDEELFGAAVDVANSFADVFASALNAQDFDEALDLGFDDLIEKQLINAFVLSPEVQEQIKEMVELWNRIWEDGELTDEELLEWRLAREEFRATGRRQRQRMRDAGFLDDSDDTSSRPLTGGSRITNLTGAARDHFSDLLAPLQHLGAHLVALQDIRRILDDRLPRVSARSATAAGVTSGGVTITGPITVQSSATTAEQLFRDLGRIADRRRRGQ